MISERMQELAGVPLTENIHHDLDTHPRLKKSSLSTWDVKGKNLRLSFVKGKFYIEPKTGSGKITHTFTKEEALEYLGLNESTIEEARFPKKSVDLNKVKNPDYFPVNWRGWKESPPGREE